MLWLAPLPAGCMVTEGLFKLAALHWAANRTSPARTGSMMRLAEHVWFGLAGMKAWF